METTGLEVRGELFCVVLCTATVHSKMHSYEQFSQVTGASWFRQILRSTFAYLFLVESLVVRTRANDCLGTLVSEMSCYV